MGSKPSSVQQPSFSLKTGHGGLRKKSSRQVVQGSRCSIQLQAPPPGRLYRLRWTKRIRVTSSTPSVRSIREICRFSNGSLQSIQRDELRVVNSSRPQTPESIDQSQKSDDKPGLRNANIGDTYATLLSSSTAFHLGVQQPPSPSVPVSFCVIASVLPSER